MISRPWYRMLPWMVAYAAAMALLEAAVVIYLRALYYPDGFRFPLVPMDHALGVTEVLREVATMIMLLVPGTLIARTAMERFSWFCILFGLWDIFYYLWLKILIDWPASLLDQDILFLIPVPWVAPALAPCIVSAGLIAFGTLLLRAREKDQRFRLMAREWALLALGVSLILCSFILDHLAYLSKMGAGASAWSIDPHGGPTFGHAAGYVPRSFSWSLFIAGCALGAAPIAGFARRSFR